MPTSNNLKSGEKGVENFEKLYVFIHKEKKGLQIPYCKLSHRLNSQRIKLEFEGFFFSLCS